MSIQLPADCIEPIATSVADHRKSVATVLFLVAGLFAITTLAVVFEPARYGRGDAAATFAGIMFWFVLLAGIGASVIRKGRRARAAGRRATTDPTMTWFLNERMIVAIDGNGVPRPELSFKIGSKHHVMLTAVPRAQVLPPR